MENYILEREDLRTALMRKGVSRLKYGAGLVNSSDQTLLPRLFLTWRLWVIKRKIINRTAHRMLAYRRKGGLLHAFNTWKRGFPLVHNSLKKYNRKQLFGVIAKMDNDIKTLESMVENNSTQVNYLESYSNLLETHARRGQNQSLSLSKLKFTETLRKGLNKWQVFTWGDKFREVAEALRLTDDELYRLKMRYAELEEENRGIIGENMELRQASLDGIAIADAIETLSNERERLSVDLADRAATIRRLLEENAELAARLKYTHGDYSEFKSTKATIPEKDISYKHSARF